VDQPTNTNEDPLYILNGPMTRSKTKALNALVLKVSTKSDLKGPLEYQEWVFVHLIHVYFLVRLVENIAKKIKESYYNLETTWTTIFSFSF